jgi:hypothetical protein
MKKKIMYTLITLAVLIFAGCKGNDKETNFIPTLPPDFINEDIDIPDDTNEDIDEPVDGPDDTEDDTEFTGETTTKYVKLSSYGAILNVRSAPSSDTDNVVGFLVHTEPVEVVSIENEWAKFLHHGEIRYVSAEFLVDFVPPYISPPTQIIEGN